MKPPLTFGKKFGPLSIRRYATSHFGGYLVRTVVQLEFSPKRITCFYTTRFYKNADVQSD